MSELVTGEAVVLGLRPARLPSRGLAVVVDLAVAWGLYIGVSMLLVSATSSMDTAAVAAVSVATFVLIQVGIPIVIETLSHGRSLGKLMCGLRVVREDGGPIRFRHALVRGAMGAIEIVLTMGVVASVASLVSARGRRIGDVFAGTLVVRERIPVAEAGATSPPPPPWLMAEVGALDLSRVPDGWWLAVRQYLMRMGQLDPQAGGAMAGRLAEDLRGFTGVAWSQGVHPAAYLAAVVAERQARESQRAFGAPGVSQGRGGAVGSDAPGAGLGVVAPPKEGMPAVQSVEGAGVGWPAGSVGEETVAYQGSVAGMPSAGASAGGGAGAPGGGWSAPGGGPETKGGSVPAGSPVPDVVPGIRMTERANKAQGESRGDSGETRRTGFAPPV
ncbi:RDD family protein [Streptomyces sp. NPDC017993]|uniref:RDD family protein n=1 Tax=Streptomyces sp. NPDC017993 TaxID=3365027 RepID=UPI00378E98C6